MGEVPGETFLEKSFPRTLFKKLLNKGKDIMLIRGFTVAEVQCKVSALDDWRSRPAVALRVRLRASPFAQDDTVGKVWQEKLEIALDLLGVQRYFKVRICAGIPALFFSFKANKKAFSCGRRGTTVVVDEEFSG